MFNSHFLVSTYEYLIDTPPPPHKERLNFLIIILNVFCTLLLLEETDLCIERYFLMNVSIEFNPHAC